MATFYFNGAVDNNWATLGNWFNDAEGTVAASSLPTAADSVIASASIDSNSGDEPTVANFTMNDPNADSLVLSITLNVTGNATFNGSSYNTGTLTGNATFNDNASAYLGAINGNATFNDNAFNFLGIVYGNAEFNDSSQNLGGGVTNNATFNSSAQNNGVVYGNATFNDTSSNSVLVVGTATFNDASYHSLTSGASIGNLILGTRTPYPLRSGINNSNILGLI